MRALRSDGNHGYDGPNSIDNHKGFGCNPTNDIDGDGGEKKQNGKFGQAEW